MQTHLNHTPPCSNSISSRRSRYSVRPPRRLWRQSGVALFASLTALQFASRPAIAQMDAWNGGDDYWDVAANWTAGLPTTTSDVSNGTVQASLNSALYITPTTFNQNGTVQATGGASVAGSGLPINFNELAGAWSL